MYISECVTALLGGREQGRELALMLSVGVRCAVVGQINTICLNICRFVPSLARNRPRKFWTS